MNTSQRSNTINSETMKKNAAQAAIEYVFEKNILLDQDAIIGVGTGSTVKHFIEALGPVKHKINGAIASSLATEKLLKEQGIPLCDLNSVSSLSVYVDGADEIDDRLCMIKGGGAALTREKIIAAVAKNFICIADESKKVDLLGKFPLPIEVIPMARSYVAREIVKMGGNPVYRNGVVTDNGNVILDVWNLNIVDPILLETQLNNIVGVVTCGLFAQRAADVLILANESGVIEYYQMDRL